MPWKAYIKFFVTASIYYNSPISGESRSYLAHSHQCYLMDDEFYFACSIEYAAVIRAEGPDDSSQGICLSHVACIQEYIVIRSRGALASSMHKECSALSVRTGGSVGLRQRLFLNYKRSFVQQPCCRTKDLSWFDCAPDTRPSFAIAQYNRTER